MHKPPLFAVVGTPIGNLDDLSKRALDTIRVADTIFAENTQTTLGLLNKFNLKKRIISYHKDNEKTAVTKILNELSIGNRCVLISEAGMPCISDPGAIAIRSLIENNIPFEVIPGPTALIQGLIASGYSGGEFYFYGFVPHKTTEKRKIFENFKNIGVPIIFYESPHRIKETVQLLFEYFTPPIAICREMTKIYEETLFINNLEDVENITEKGEFVVVANSTKKENEKNVGVDTPNFVKKLKDEKFSTQDIVKILKALGVKRNIAYKMVNDE